MPASVDTFSNSGISTILGGAGGSGTQLGAADTSLLLPTGNGNSFPISGPPFMVQLGTVAGAHELVKCTARATDTLTIVRGQENTTAQIWPVGTAVQQVVTNGNMIDLWKSSPGVFNVMASYGGQPGATGDGVTNDTNAINNAIAAAGAAGGGIVEFPPGIYQVSSPLTLSTAQVRLRGCGLASWIRPTAGFTGAQVILITANFCGVLDLQIQGTSGTYSSNPAANGIQITGAVGTLLQNLYIQAINGWAVQSSATAGQANFNTVMSNVRACQGAQGFHLLGVTGSGFNGVHFLRDCYANQTENGDCYFFEDVHDVVVSNILGETAAGSGNSINIKGACASIYLSNADIGPFPGPATAATVLIESGTNGAPTQIAINGGIIEGGSTGVNITAGTNIQIANCHIYNCGTFGVNLSGACDAILVTGCLFEANGSAGTTGRYDLITVTSGHVEITGCYFATPQGSTAGKTNNAIFSSTGTVYVQGCAFYGTGYTSANIFGSNPTVVRNCPGLNPIGAITAPTIGASPFAAPIQNFDMTVYIVGGTVSVISVGGVATGFTLAAGGQATVRVPAGQALAITYTAAPTWKWFGD